MTLGHSIADLTCHTDCLSHSMGCQHKRGGRASILVRKVMQERSKRVAILETQVEHSEAAPHPSLLYFHPQSTKVGRTRKPGHHCVTGGGCPPKSLDVHFQALSTHRTLKMVACLNSIPGAPCHSQLQPKPQAAPFSRGV